jgi:Spy/CpxP family protein refolding chaperone
MRVSTILALAGSIVALCALSATAQKEKSPGALDLPYWTLKGQPARQFVPGLNAVLLLTTDQKQRLATAWYETVRSDAVSAAATTVKTDPNASAAQKQAALETIAAANNQFHQSLQTILTPEQKALIERINALYVEVQKAAADGFQNDLAAAKGNKEETERIRTEIRSRLESELDLRLASLLSSEQRAAMQKAAADEKRAVESKRTKTEK